MEYFMLKFTKVKKNILCYAILSIALAFLVIRCFFGFDPTDESFYYTIPLRFLKGDCPIIDEWNVSQFYSILLCPIVWLFTVVTGSTQGRSLYGRLVYCLISLILSIGIFHSFRKRIGCYSALCCALLYLFCARGNIMGISYYKLYSCFLTLAVVLYMHFLGDQKSFRPLQWFIIGLTHGLAALCMPYFVLFILAGSILAISKKKIREALSYLCAAMLILILFLSIIFVRGYGITEIITNFSYMMEDPEHSVDIFAKTIYTILELGRQCFAGIPLVLYTFWRILKRRSLNVYWQFFVLISFILMAIFGYGLTIPGALYNQTVFLTFPLLFVKDPELKRSSNFRLGQAVYLYGVISAILFWIGSNTRTSCLVTGFIISQIGAALMISEIKERYQDAKLINGKSVCINRVVTYSLSILAVVFVFFAGVVRLTVFYRDARLPKLTSQISQGPAMGIFTEENKYNDYCAVLEGLEDVKKNSAANSRILVSRKAPWVYLAADLPFGTCTAWTKPLDNDQQEAYLKIHANRFPDIVIVMHDDVGISVGFDADLNPNAGNARKGYVWEQIKKRGYTVIEYPAFTAYINPSAVETTVGIE